MYELDENMKPIVSMKFLGDEETVKKAMESVANQVSSGQNYVSRNIMLITYIDT